MKCDDFLSRLETGNWLSRAAARRHAANCRQCTAAQAALDRMKQTLATHEPLSPRARHLWAHAAENASAAPPRWRLAFPIAVGVAGVAIVALLVVNLAIHRDTHVPEPKTIVQNIDSKPTVETLDPSVDLSRMDANVSDLNRRLTRLRERAERLDARRQVAIAYDRYSHW